MDLLLYLGYIRKYLIEGFIPILEFASYKNAINGFKIELSKGNPWKTIPDLVLLFL